MSEARGWLLDWRRLGEGWRGLVAAALLYALLLACLFPEGVFQGEVFHGPDSVAPQGFAEYVAEQGLDHAYWNPFIFAGMPAHASLSYNPGLYPVTLPLRWLIDHLHLPPLSWLLVHYLWLALGIFAFLRGRGVRPWLAWLGGAFFLLLPPQVAIGAHGHGSKVMTLSWLPWILRAADRLVDAGGRRALLDTGLLAASLACLLLAAHIQVAYYALLTLGLFGLGRVGLRMRREGCARGLAPLALALLALALAAGASLLLFGPVQEYSAHSIRGAASGGGAAYDYATLWSLHPREWSTFLWPASWGYGAETYFGHMPMTDYANYIGLLPLLAAVLLFWRRPRNFDLFWLLVLLATTVVAAGRHFPLLYRPLYDWLPGFNRFRIPVMILILQQLAAALLMARGLELALRDGRALGRLRNLLAGGVLLLVLSAAVGPDMVERKARPVLRARYGAQLARIQPAQARQILDGLVGPSGRWLRADALRGALLLLLVAAALEYRRREIQSPKGGGKLPAEALLAMACALLILGDLIPLDRKVLHPEAHWEFRKNLSLWGAPRQAALTLPPRTLAFLADNLDGQRFHALPGSAFGANEASAAGLASLGGYHSAKLALADSVLKALPRGGAALLNRFSVRYLLSPQGGNYGPGFAPATEPGQTEEAVYENHNALPRLRLTDRLLVEDPTLSRQRLFEGRAEAGLTYLAAEPGPAITAGEGPPGVLAAVVWGLDAVRCRASLERASLLVLADMHFPGWGVRVDGQERPLLMADGLFRAVVLSPGDRSVEFYYRPADLALYGGLRAGAFGLTALLILLGLPWGDWTRRGRHVGTAPVIEEASP